MQRIAVRIVEEGFLHPAARLEREVVGDYGLLHVPVEGLDDAVQFFRCRVELPVAEAARASTCVEHILTDGATLAARPVVQRFVASRFQRSILLYLRSQAIGRVAVDCAVEGVDAQTAAASVAVVMRCVAADESELIRVEVGGARHDFAVEVDEAGHWARPVC